MQLIGQLSSADFLLAHTRKHVQIQEHTSKVVQNYGYSWAELNRIKCFCHDIFPDGLQTQADWIMKILRMFCLRKNLRS